MKLDGATAIISGASRGIGFGIAKAFAERGANIVLLGRNKATLLTAHREVSQAKSNQHHEVFPMDVSNPDDWTELCKTVDSPKFLVNVAGITQYSLLPRTSITTIDAILSTNLAGAIYGSRAASKLMLRDGGCIINISSALAHRGGSGSSIYAASKAGLNGFTKALAEELGPRGIRCNAICPGYIETDMVSGMSPEMRKRTIEKTGMRRIGTVQEVAEAAIFLAENDFMNGSIVTIDGGLTYE